MSPRDAATQRQSVTVPAPTFAHLGPHDTPAVILRGVSGKLHDGYEIGGSNVRAGLARLCENVAKALDQPDRADTPYGDLDDRLLALAEHLDRPVADRLRRLLAGDAVAHRVIDAEQRAQRAEDLAAELRRQMRSLERQLERLQRAEPALRPSPDRILPR